jgi:hypothetical protein
MRIIYSHRESPIQGFTYAVKLTDGRWEFNCRWHNKRGVFYTPSFELGWPLVETLCYVRMDDIEQLLESEIDED